MNKSELELLLTGKNKHLFKCLPGVCMDALDAFVMHFVKDLAMKIRGCGLPAINAEMKLEALGEMTYPEIRDVAERSPVFVEFLRQDPGQVKDKASWMMLRRQYYTKLHHELRLKTFRAIENPSWDIRTLIQQSETWLAAPNILSGVDLRDTDYINELEEFALSKAQCG